MDTNVFVLIKIYESGVMERTIINLKRRKSIIQFDPEDLDIIESHPWAVAKNGLVRAAINQNGKTTIARLHRLIGLRMFGKSKLLVGHLNGDRTDNRRANLTLVSQSQITQVSMLWKGKESGHDGVFYCDKRKRWYAVCPTNKTILGYFFTINDALKAQEIAIKNHILIGS